MIKLYRCSWLSEKQKTNISYALNTMQDKATIMGVSDMPGLRQIENTDLITRSYPTQTQHPSKIRKQSFNLVTPTSETVQISSSISMNSLSSFQNPTETNLASFEDQTNQTEETSRSLNSFSANLKDTTPMLTATSTAKKSLQTLKSIIGSEPTSKHDTRIVNEAFQDAVQMLENGFSSKMQAEMLVLVDVLHKPATVFPKNSSFRVKSQDKRFIGK